MEEADEEYFPHSQENRDKTEGCCEDLDCHSLDHTSETDEPHAGGEWGDGVQLFWPPSMTRVTIRWEPTDEHSWEMVEASCSHEKNEDQDYDRDKGERGGGGRDLGETDIERDDWSMVVFSGCGHAERGKSTLIGVGSARMGGSGGRSCGEGAQYGHLREEAEVQPDVVRPSNTLTRERLRGRRELLDRPNVL